MKRKTGLLSFVFLLLMTSCVSFEKFSIEVYKPSELNFNSRIKRVVLVSRNLKYPNDTLQYYQVRNRRLIKDKIRYNTDSLAIKTCLDSLVSRIIARNQFDTVFVLPVNTFPVMRVKEIRPAKMEWYKMVSEKTGADALILLDMFSCFYTFNTENSTPVAEVITSNIWSVYQAQGQKITARFSQVDTLYWDETDESGRYKKIRIPDKKNAISLAAGVIGENYSKHIFPAWAKVDRNFMLTGDQAFEKAVKLAQNNKWSEASDIWLACSKGNGKLRKSVALYNLALASEMNGDIDHALEYAGKAAEASSGIFMSAVNDAVRKYSVVLYQRKNEINKLNKQNENR
jgi:hypothetical protein